MGNDSITPTFAAIALHIKNRRWDGVPFFMKAGKALSKHYAEIRILFHDVPGSLYGATGTEKPNELVIRIQPEEAIIFKVMNKVPGLKMHLEQTKLDMMHEREFEGTEIPESLLRTPAYERLILD